MKNLYKFVVLAIIGLFFFVNISTLNDGHNWGDDFAQYIQHAVNLVEHKPYASNISFDHWIVLPPGFPLLLSSVIYWFGINFKALKSLNILFWVLSAFAAYGIALMELNLFWASLLTGWFLSTPIFFFFKQNVLSDIPFMCFTLLSIWTLMRSEELESKGQKTASRFFILLSIFCMGYSFLIRWAGISLFLAAILYFGYIKKDWKRSSGYILGALISCLIAAYFGASVSAYFDKTTVSLSHDWFWICLYNLSYTFQMILSLFISNEEFFLKLLTPVTFAVINGLVAMLFICLFSLFLIRIYNRQISFMGCFAVIYLIGIILWPIHAGTRYLFPMMVPLAVYLVKWTKPSWRRLLAVIFLVLIIQNIGVTVLKFNFNDNEIYQKDPLEMMRWVEQHVKPGETYMFDKPRVLGLLTGRIGHNFGTYPQDIKYWYKRIKPQHINYLIMDKGYIPFRPYDNFRLRVDNYELYINLVWENNKYRIFNVELPSNNSMVPSHLVHL